MSNEDNDYDNEQSHKDCANAKHDNKDHFVIHYSLNMKRLPWIVSGGILS